MLDKAMFNEILKSKEDRALKQEEIIKNHSFTLISFTLNIPGKIKDSPLYRSIHNEGMISIEKLLNETGVKVIHKEVICKKTGSEGFISVDMDPILLKQLSIDMEENHPLGRIFDIDIFSSTHNQINRTHINKEPRQCLICEGKAVDCIRAKTHTAEELIEKIQNIARGYFR